MILSINQIQNISKTIYFLMRGTYDLNFFDSPYNKLIPNEYDEKDGKAVKYFYAVYNNIDSLATLFNQLDHTDTKEYDIIDRLHDVITDMLEDLTMDSILKGYLYEKKVIDYNFGPSPYQSYFKIQMFCPNSVESKNYNRLSIIFDIINKYLAKIGDTKKEGSKIIDELWESLELLYTVFVDIGFIHGKELGKGNYPIWYNPEFYDKISLRPHKNMTAETIKDLYYSAGEILDPTRKYISSDAMLHFCECQDNMHKLFPDHVEQIDKMCFYHTLMDAEEINNAYYNGFEFGLRMAVDIFYNQKK